MKDKLVSYYNSIIVGSSDVGTTKGVPAHENKNHHRNRAVNAKTS